MNPILSTLPLENVLKQLQLNLPLYCHDIEAEKIDIHTFFDDETRKKVLHFFPESYSFLSWCNDQDFLLFHKTDEGIETYKLHTLRLNDEFKKVRYLHMPDTIRQEDYKNGIESVWKHFMNHDTPLSADQSLSFACAHLGGPFGNPNYIYVF